MNILFILQPSHWRIGCYRIAERYRVLAHKCGLSSSIMVMPHDDVEQSMRWHDYPNVKIAKKTYDHIFAFESLPPESWFESANSVWWVPMVEFTTFDQLERAPCGLKILWHSIAGFDQARLVRPDLEQIYVPFGLADASAVTILPRLPISILLHQRARSVDTEKVATMLLADHSLDCNITIWDNLRRNSPISSSDSRLTISSGWMEHNKWLEMAGNHDIYVSTRAHEGVGLCNFEATDLGCAIVSPLDTTIAEYYSSRKQGAVHIKLCRDHDSESKRRWLCPRYEWETEKHHEKHGITQLVQTLADLTRNPQEVIELRQAAKMRSDHLVKEFEMSMTDIFKSLTPRHVVGAPKSRRRILTIQACRWGGQGLFELWVNEQMSRRSYLSLFSTCLWNQPYDKLEQKEQCRLIENSTVRFVAPSYDDMNSVDPDIVIVHWSTGSEQLWINEHRADMMRFIKDTKARVIIIAHNVEPNLWPEWLSRDLVLHPTFESMRVHNDTVPRSVLSHFLNKDALTAPIYKKNPMHFVIGIVGRVRWTKLDPVYLHELSLFKTRLSGVRYVWLGGTSDGYMESDSILDETIKPQFHSAYGPDRFRHMDTMNVAIHLSGVQEAFGLASLELVCRGVPVITNRPEVHNIIREGSVLIGSPSELKAALSKMATDHGFMEKLKTGCATIRKHSRHFVDWEADLMGHIGNLLYGVPNNPWTVIVTAHKMENTIECCLDSVLANRPCNVIVVIDGGHDKTEEVVRDYVETHPEIHDIITIVGFQGDGHCQAWSWKQALKHVNTRLVAFVDGDDEIMPEALSRMATEYIGDPGLAMAWSDQYVYDGNGLNILDISFSSPLNGSLLSAIEDGENVISHLITARYSSLQLITLDTDLMASADKDIALKLEEVGRITHVPEKLYKYKWKRPGSVTDRMNDIQEECRLRVIESAKKRRNTRNIKY